MKGGHCFFEGYTGMFLDPTQNLMHSKLDPPPDRLYCTHWSVLYFQDVICCSEIVILIPK